MTVDRVAGDSSGIRGFPWLVIGLSVALVFTHLKQFSASSSRSVPTSQTEQANIHAVSSSSSEAPITASSLDFYYSIARGDRSGSVLHDMLRAHAFAFSNHKTYGGACVTAEKMSIQRFQQHNELVNELGLDNVLRFLPCSKEEALQMVGRNQTHRQDGTEKWFTTDWLNYIHSQINMEHIIDKKNESVFEIGVHMRRGDITPCEKFKDRYLPNSHYLALIDKYIARSPHNKKPHVTIYSESQSFEQWDEVQARHFSFAVDTTLSEAWKGMISSDVLIMSRSSFSYVPAILNPSGIIVYTNFRHKPLPTWEIVNDVSLLNATNVALANLRRRCKER